MKVGKKNRSSQLAVASAVCAIGLVLGLGSPALALTYSTQYEMDADPSTPAGVLDGNGADANGSGVLSVGPAGSGSTFASGILHYIDNTGSGNFGYYFNQASAADIAFTVDIRVKANNNVNASSDARSMGFNGGSSKGRGLRLNNPGGGSCTVGSGQITTGASAEACVDLSTFRNLRIVVDGAGNGGLGLLKVWDLDGATLLLTAASVGGSGFGSEVGNGGFHIGSLSGGITTSTDFELDYVRVLLGTAVDDATTVIDELPPPSCSVTVTPSAGSTATGYELGATPPPTPIDYTINNLGGTTINYTASEVDTLGVGTDYPWLSLSPTAGSVAGGSDDTVTATMDTTSLTPGTYTAYVKLTDDCPAATPCLSDTFTYPDGNLIGNGGWTTGSATAGEINITGNEVHILGNSVSKDAINAISCSADGTGIISVKVKIEGQITHTQSTMWAMWINDAEGDQFGRWFGTDETARGRDHASTVTAVQTLTVGVFDELEVRIHTASNMLEWFFNGTSLGSFAHQATCGDTIGSIRFERINNPGAAGGDVALDDLEVSVFEPHVRRIDLTVIGCSVEVQEPRIRWVGPCNSDSTTTEVFTIKNNGSADWTGYQAIELGDDDDWMTVTYTSSPVVRFATATVTATIDWSQVPIVAAGDDQASRIRFSATCDGGSTFVHDTPSVGGGIETVNVIDNVTAPMKMLYNGDVSPSNNDSAGAGFRFELFDSSIEQGAVVGDPGVGQASDGLAYQVTDLGTAKTKWRSVLNAGTAGPNIDSKVGATALARVKVTSATGSNNGNLMILETNVGGSYHWGGANNIVREVARGNSATVAGDGAYHILRLTTKDTQITGTGIVVNLYLDENPTPVLTINNALAADGGNSGFDALGFGTSSTSDDQTIYFDWVTGTNSGAFAPGEEVACIDSLIPTSLCNVPRVDVDDDDDVDMDDFAAFQTCYTGPLVSPPPLSQLCDCFDDDNDNDIDIADFNAFVDCETGAEVPWVSSANCPN